MSYKLPESIDIVDGKTFILKKRMQDIIRNSDGDHAEDWKGYPDDKFAKVILDEITNTDRWSTHHYCVFILEGKYYATHYSEGSTEIQDESPYEYDGDWIEVTEVVPKEVTVVKYIAK